MKALALAIVLAALILTFGHSWTAWAQHMLHPSQKVCLAYLADPVIHCIQWR